VESRQFAEFVIGMHFFSPANVMRLIEIVRGSATSKEVIATCMRLSRKLGEVGVLVGNCTGFVGNRMFGPTVAKPSSWLKRVRRSRPWTELSTTLAWRWDPLATADLAGLDVRWRIRKEHRHLQKPGVRQPIIEDNLCELGRYGQ
jgi:3-hydroxyacyl-CoA dehydrogenase